MSKPRVHRPRRSRPWRAFRAVALVDVLLVLGLVAAAWLVLLPWWEATRADAVAMVDRHRTHDTAHPGWSFPGRVWSAPAPLDAPAVVVAREAKARGYVAACPPTAPGEYCAKTGKVIPRGGRFPEGDQPAGTEGWTRPAALEPVLLGWLVGDDAELRLHLPLADAPPHLIAALLASEDANFRDHRGVDPWGLLRAAWVTGSGEGKQGASTLSMQLVRNLTQDKERSLARKLREIATAVAIDQHLGKDGLLEMYLDAPYLGQDGNLSVCGFEAASRFYWGKGAKDLTLSESATLAGILPAPGRWSPDAHPADAKVRRDLVLDRLLVTGYDPAAVEAARAEPVEAHARSLMPNERYPAYLSATRDALERELPREIVYGAGLDVWTALDPGLQDATDRLLDERSQYLEKTVGRRGTGRLLVATALIDKRGALVAIGDPSMKASTDFNRATQARRQAGSSFKPLVYALAFNEVKDDGTPKFTMASTVPNMPRTFPNTDGWRPKNIGGRYSTTTALANALPQSLNIATASLLEQAGGPQPLIDLAKRFGIDTREFPAEMGLALGQGTVTPFEMARFVASLIADGHKVEGSPILLAVDGDGDVRASLHPPGEAVISVEAAKLTRELMRLVVAQGTGGAVHGGGGFPGYDGEIIGKTGTANDEKDLWFIGATPEYSGALWLGYDQPTRIGASASDFAAPLFGWWFKDLTEGTTHPKFEKGDLERRWICTQSGLSSGAGCSGVQGSFIPGTAPKGSCPIVHPPPSEVPVEAHKSLWKRIAEAAALREAAKEGDGAPIALPDPEEIEE